MVDQIVTAYYFIALITVSISLIGLGIIPNRLPGAWNYVAVVMMWSLVPVSLFLIIYHIWN
jgi:hypothetical protein